MLPVHMSGMNKQIRCSTDSETDGVDNLETRFISIYTF